MTKQRIRGLKTVEDVRQRCRINEDTGCWHWTGAMKVSHKGRKTPNLWIFDSVRGEMRLVSAGLAMLELAGRRTPQMQRGWRTCLCDDCLNPAHIMGGTANEWGSFMRAIGAWKNNPQRIAVNRRIMRKHSVITPEIAEKVRNAPTGRAAAREFGITESHASKIRRGLIWTNRVLPGASVFALGAR